MNWLMDYKKHLTYTLPLVVIMAFFIFKVTSSKGSHEKDYLMAKSSFDKWVNSSESASFTHLCELMKKHEDLVPEYDHLMVQHLLISEEADKAENLTGKIFDRAPTQSPYYQDFARTSITISHGEYEEALKQALRLKDKLGGDEAFWDQDSELANFGSNLVAFNLLRIASLYGEIGNFAKEAIAWNELSQYVGWDKDEEIKPDLKIFDLHFGSQQVSLKDYIEFRQKLQS